MKFDLEKHRLALITQMAKYIADKTEAKEIRLKYQERIKIIIKKLRK